MSPPFKYDASLSRSNTMSLVIDPALKARIEAFLTERRNKNTALEKAPEDIVHMDVT